MCIECGSVRVERSESAEEIAYADGCDERNQKFGAIECKEATKNTFSRELRVKGMRERITIKKRE